MTEEFADEFTKALASDPSLLARLKKSADLAEFKEKYNLDRATPFKCPACSGAGMQSPGSLWIDKDNRSRFVCRKCRCIFIITCETIPTEELIYNLRLIQKGDEEATLNWDRRITSKGGGGKDTSQGIEGDPLR